MKHSKARYTRMLESQSPICVQAVVCAEGTFYWRLKNVAESLNVIVQNCHICLSDNTFWVHSPNHRMDSCWGTHLTKLWLISKTFKSKIEIHSFCRTLIRILEFWVEEKRFTSLFMSKTISCILTSPWMKKLNQKFSLKHYTFGNFLKLAFGADSHKIPL